MLCSANVQKEKKKKEIKKPSYDIYLICTIRSKESVSLMDPYNCIFVDTFLFFLDSLDFLLPSKKGFKLDVKCP